MMWPSKEFFSLIFRHCKINLFTKIKCQHIWTLMYKSSLKNSDFIFWNQSYEKIWLMFNSFLNECFPKLTLLRPLDINFITVILRSTSGFKNYFLLNCINYATYHSRQFTNYLNPGKHKQPNLELRNLNILNTIKYAVYCRMWI